MNLLFVSNGLASTADSTDVIPERLSLLGAGLCNLGHRVRVYAPLLDEAAIDRLSLARRLTPVEVVIAGETKKVIVHDGKLPSGIELVLFGSDELFGTWAATEQPPEDALAQAVLAKASLAHGDEDGPWHVVHGVSARCALAPHFAKAEGGIAQKSMLLLDDLDDHPRFAKEWVDKLELGMEGWGPGGFELFGELSLLKAGLNAADRTVFTSRSALNRKSKDDGDRALLGAIGALAEAVVALPPALDFARWNPATDEQLSTRYDVEHRLGKQSCKADLQSVLGLPVRHDVPLFAIAAPVDELATPLRKCLESALRSEVQLVAPRGLPSSLEKALDEAVGQWPTKVARIDLVDRSERRLLSAADFMIIEAEGNPSGQTLLRALRYGALPITESGKGLTNDLVVDTTGDLESGVGFLVPPKCSEKDLAMAIQRAATAHCRRELFDDLQKRAMAVPRSYEDLARMTEHLYTEMFRD